MFYVVKNGGERIEQISRKLEIIASGNKGKYKKDRSVSAEVYLDLPDTPYTIVVTTLRPNKEASCTLSVFSQDPVKLVPMKSNLSVDDDTNKKKPAK